MYFFNFIELFKSVFLWLKSKMARIYLQRKFPTLRDHIIEKTTRNFSLVARYLLKFTRCSLLLVEPLVTRCKICSLLVAEVARCKKSLVTRCKIRSLLVAEVARCKKSLVTRCKIRSLLVAKFTCYSSTTYYVKLVKFSYGRKNLNEFGSIYWMFYINKIHVLPEWSVFLTFSVNCSQVAMFQIMPSLCPHGQGKDGSGQPNVDRPGQGEG